MDTFVIAMIMSVISVTVGFFMLLIKKLDYKRNNAPKYKIHICNITCVIGLAIYFRFLICVSVGTHRNSSVKYTEYPIEKLTFSSVYFNGRDGDSFNESYVILEEHNDKYENVVVVETEYYTLSWIFNIRTSSDKYHVYLSEEVYQRFQDGETIYKNNK